MCNFKSSTFSVGVCGGAFVCHSTQSRKGACPGGSVYGKPQTVQAFHGLAHLLAWLVEQLFSASKGIWNQAPGVGGRGGGWGGGNPKHSSSGLFAISMNHF